MESTSFLPREEKIRLPARVAAHDDLDKYKLRLDKER